jgi:hypothetical protein
MDAKDEVLLLLFSFIFIIAEERGRMMQKMKFYSYCFSVILNLSNLS